MYAGSAIGVTELAATPQSNQSPKKASRLQILAIVIITFTVTIALFYYMGMFDEFQAVNPNPNPTTLTPARKLEGTWKTPFPVKFYIKTDFETFGELTDVGSENRSMTWKITGTGNENVVDVEVQFTVSNRQLVTGSGYTPDVSPIFLRGTINGDRLTLSTSDGRTVGEFSFTTHIITGTWSDSWSMVYEQEVYTTTNSLILTKQ